MRNAGAADKTAHTFCIVTGVLLALALVKIAAAVFFSPLMGYGNNYDFIRQASCVGVYQTYPGQPNKISNPQGPVDSLVYSGVVDPSHCMKSIDNLYPWIASRFFTPGERIGFRAISAWKIATLMVFLGGLLALARGRWVRLAVALCFFLVFGDLTLLLYANTLYLEFSVVLSGFFALFATALLLHVERENWKPFALALVSIAWLGASKQQYMPLAAALALLCALILLYRWADKRYAVAFFIAAIGIPLGFAAANKATNSELLRFVSYANNTDTWLGAVLPFAHDKPAALARVGLPASCEAAIGKDWYSPGVMDHHPCPDVEKLSRVQLLSLFVHDSTTLRGPMHLALERTFPLYPVSLGQLTDPETAHTARYRLLRVTSLSHLLTREGAKGYMAAAVAALALGLVAFVAWLRAGRCTRAFRLTLAMIWLGSGTIFYSVASSVFGDGYTELQKHAVLALPGFGFVITGTLLSLCQLALRQAAPPPGEPRG